jgi:hypothetical protein
VAVGLARCDCGHVFESAGYSLSPLEATLRDEELYEGYLAARSEQARQAARTAHEALAEDTSNPELVAACALAREVAKSIEDDLVEQQNKIAAMRNTLRALEPAAPTVLDPPAVSKSSAVTEKTASRQPPAAPSITARPTATATVAPAPAVLEKTNPVIAATEPASVPVWHVATTQSAAGMSASHQTPAAPVSARPTPAATMNTIPAASEKTTPVAAAPAKPASVWRATTTQKAAGVLAALKNAKVRESIARAQQAVAIAEMEKTSAQASANAHGAVPPSAFRKEQASKAEKIMEARKAIDGKECPNCTSCVPVNTTRCQCGFAFVSGGTDLPSLTLCTGDFTALRNSLKLNLR